MSDILCMEEAELFVDFDSRAVTSPFGGLDEVTPAFATTIRKAKPVLYPFTRGKRLVVLVGRKKFDGHEGERHAGEPMSAFWSQSGLRPTTAEAISAWRPDRTTPYQQ